MYLIDTNILIADILSKYETDKISRKYRKFYSKISLSERIITDFILGEFEQFISQVFPHRYKVSHEKGKEIDEALHVFLSEAIHTFTLDYASTFTTIKASALYGKFLNIHPIGFFDSLLLSLAQEKSYVLLTQDKRLTACAQELKIEFVNL
ncbi:hypothetical protein A3D77_00885 [Candidatus Gottesmanbacteria bacterium RIFCSPHIGHO2_02_FULL_39_11]|uniref:PIN domain-containing protein n=1 Tax=Candidatus Gottesmanbacteria bacterium RIFCSPHIGHO2_02_FULL_39_11 TaxID=1798382 RepID=A0A1F5ZNN1_9BACT|nr:MAG: hypothetical protein A3D77_00885 [Candidatus Gottesmanbacteria bacterium RIFCSPHIGHO2_02_FULL_39_11]